VAYKGSSKSHHPLPKPFCQFKKITLIITVTSDAKVEGDE